MRRFLLVDDEENIRIGLRTIIERSDILFDDIGECENGKDALETLSKEGFDIVVVDIKMPLMDGLTLIKEAKNLNIKSEFIILSGYDDFSYAKTAMKYGISEYLLKPVDRFEFLEAIRNIEYLLQKKENAAQELGKADHLINKLVDHELGFIFSNETLSQQEFVNSLISLNVGIFENPFTISIFYTYKEKFVTDSNVSIIEIRSHLKNFTDSLEYPTISFINVEGDLVLIAHNDLEHLRVLAYLKEYTGNTYSVGVSNTGKNIDDVRMCYHQAREAIKYRIVRPVDSIISYTQVESLNSSPTVPLDLLDKINQMISACNIDEARQLLLKLLDEESLYGCSIRYVSVLVESIYQHLVHAFLPNSSPKLEFLMEDYEILKNINSFKHIKDYILMLNRYLDEIGDFFTALKDINSNNTEIDTAIKYINENYFKDLNMTIVANQISLNYSYFSSLFLKQTGLNFSDYLKKVRVGKAKVLLADTAYPINVISQKTGFKNARHFARVFRELVGIQPTEYRNKPVV